MECDVQTNWPISELLRLLYILGRLRRDKDVVFLGPGAYLQTPAAHSSSTFRSSQKNKKNTKKGSAL